MLDGWYCRSLANEQAPQQINQADMNDGNDDSDTDSQNNGEHRGANASVDYKTQYRYLKQKLKFLIYENEFFQDALRSNQRRLLKVSRDKAFLLDRLLQYEKPENCSSDSDETEESSEDETQKELKKKKMEQSTSSTAGGGGSTRGRKKKIPQTTPISAEVVKVDKPMTSQMASHIEPHFQEQHHQHQLSPAEIERQLSRRPIIDMMPERAPATVPAEMFSNEPSLDSEVNEQIIDGSTTHVAAEECVPMEYIN